MRRILLLGVLLASASASAQLWSGLLNPVDSSYPGLLTAPPAYAIPWQNNVGVGGIPARPTACATIAASSCSNGASDCSSTIQSALNSCPSGDAVLLGTGTFLIDSHLSIPSNVTLRGQGANQTVLNGEGSGGGVVLIGGGSVSYSPVTIASGATSGSTSLTLASVSGMANGTLLVVSETNNATYVTNVGTEGTATWVDGWSTNGTRARGQIVEIENITGNVVTIAPPLYGSYINTPTVVAFTPAASMAGIEDFQIYANNTGYTNSVYYSECSRCWDKGIEYNYSDGNPIEADWSYRIETRDGYVSNAFTHAPGSTDSDIFYVLKTSASLIENMILERQHVGIILNWGASGNVVGYNYSTGNFDNANNPSNCAPGTGACPQMSAFLHHGAHPFFNLWEGNVGGQLYLDSVWGTSSHDTSFRGWYKGTNAVATPFAFGTGGRTTVTTPVYYAFQAARAVQVSQLSHYDNFIGDVIGATETNGISSSRTTFLISPTNRNYSGAVYGFTFGYGEASDTSGNCSSTVTCTPETSALLHGIYSDYDGSTTWASGLTETLPPSFYLASQPTFWASGMPWPANGPDISGGPGPGGHAYGNAAMACYAGMGGVDGGVGSPLVFNRANCYTPATGPQGTQASPFVIALKIAISLLAGIVITKAGRIACS